MVLRCATLGLNSQQISEVTGIGSEKIERLTERILNKLNAQSLLHAAFVVYFQASGATNFDGSQRAGADFYGDLKSPTMQMSSYRGLPSSGNF